MKNDYDKLVTREYKLTEQELIQNIINEYEMSKEVKIKNDKDELNIKMSGINFDIEYKIKNIDTTILLTKIKEK